MRVDCKNCGEKFFVKKETVLSDAATIVGKCVALDMKKIDADGLRAFIKSKQLSIRGFARVLGVNSKTVDNWLRVGRFTGVARQSIEGGLARAYMADRWGKQEGRLPEVCHKVSLEDCFTEIAYALNYWYPLESDGATDRECEARHDRLFSFCQKLRSQLEANRAIDGKKAKINIDKRP